MNLKIKGNKVFGCCETYLITEVEFLEYKVLIVHQRFWISPFKMTVSIKSDAKR